MRPDVFSRALDRSSGERPHEVRRDPLEWARRLRAREHSGERLSPAYRRMWRDALCNELTEEERRAPC